MTKIIKTSLDSENSSRLLVSFEGQWTINEESSGYSEKDNDEICKKIGAAKFVVFDAEKVVRWDSLLLSRIFQLSQLSRQSGAVVDLTALPGGIRRLLELAFIGAAPENVEALAIHSSLFHKTGVIFSDGFAKITACLEFIGLELTMFWRTLRGERGFEWRDLFHFIDDCGVRALPIVSLISILVGLILGFIGGLQLQQFGAQVYVANLVGIAMVREMGSMMVGIIMAGRTGAAYAAQLGTMQVNEEIDALETFGISAANFLITPRVLALVLMMPLLSVYANILGVFGGLVVGTSLYDITLTQYIQQTSFSFAPKDFWIGVTKSLVYGLIISLSGCYRGFRCGRTAASVGDATTSAVVTAIVLIIVTDAIAAILCAVLGI